MFTLPPEYASNRTLLALLSIAVFAMFSSAALVASFFLLGSVFPFPHFPAKRGPGTCIQDNLIRCLTNTKSTAVASAFCAALTPFTVATVTASAYVEALAKACVHVLIHF